ncbi:MAG: flagellar hook-basal body complex protein FliE [Planctomycetota bacterium]
MTRIDPRSAGLDAWKNGVERLSRDGGSDALQRLFEQRATEVRQEFGSPELQADPSVEGPIGTDALKGIRAVDSEIQTANSLAEDLLTGKVDSPHEVAARIRRADLTLKFSLEIRNKLVDAYREVMRMSV